MWMRIEALPHWPLVGRAAASFLFLFYVALFLIFLNETNPMNGAALARSSPLALLRNDDRDPVSSGGRKSKGSRLFPCNDLSPPSFVGERGPYWVLYNYVTRNMKFACDESVTFATHSDHTYLDNLVPLLERWQGPVSLSLYAPGRDYDETLVRIHYLRACSSLVKEFVSFHLIFDKKHTPANWTRTAEEGFAKMRPVSCAVVPHLGKDVTRTLREKENLGYPLNMARNVAREMASTHYVIVSDIELYPSPQVIPNFLEMVHRDAGQLGQSPKPKVFVLPVFEVEANVSALPNDKIELRQMLDQGIAITFHKETCLACHRIPKDAEWVRAENTKGLHVFHVGKREGLYKHWEPIYIGTKLEPMYDERLMWEGSGDKQPQGYILCALDYEFLILDNAFLIHRPGIKGTNDIRSKTTKRRQWENIKKEILPELQRLYGNRPQCSL